MDDVNHQNELSPVISLQFTNQPVVPNPELPEAG